MATADKHVVPVWAVTTANISSPIPSFGEGGMTAQRLSEMRTALAMFADSPLVTLEAHPMPRGFDRGAGVPLDALSPLARHLADLVSQTAKTAPAVAKIDSGAEVLYRMVVPSKVAAEFGQGTIQPMTSKAIAGGVHSALRGSRGIKANATFVPVTLGGKSGTAIGGGAAAAGAGALTVAAPLVLMATAVAMSAAAEQKRQRAIENITRLLKDLKAQTLEHERAELAGCRDAIDKATTVLLDEGKVGASLGLDSAVHAISTATETTRGRVTSWQAALDELAQGPVELSQLVDAFPGIHEDGGEFRTHLELASLAIALRRRVIVLQAVEHSQSDKLNPFENFVRSLTSDQRGVDTLERDIASVLRRLSALQLRPPSRLTDKLMTRGQVEDLIEASYRIRGLVDAAGVTSERADVVIEIAKLKDGSILVLPARSLSADTA